MHPLYEQAAGMTRDVIGAAIEVHKDRGPGLLASVYQWCFCKELGLRGYSVETQRSVVVRYKGFEREDRLKCDVLVNSCILVEVKAVEKVPVVVDGPAFVIRLKVMNKLGYCFAYCHGAPPFSSLRSLGFEKRLSDMRGQMMD